MLHVRMSSNLRYLANVAVARMERLAFPTENSVVLDHGNYSASKIGLDSI